MLILPVFDEDSKRPVYGGGGITPDIFIPIDTTGVSDYYVKVRGFVPQFAHRYIEAHKNEFNYDIREFPGLYDVPQRTLDSFISYAKEQGVEFNEAGFQESKDDLKISYKSASSSKIIW